MGANKHESRILAIALRNRRFAYAAFEGRDRLLDWGVYFFPPADEGGGTVAGRRVGGLLRLFTPSVIVVRIANRGSRDGSSGLKRILRAIRRESSVRSIPLCRIGRKGVLQAFRIFRGNKYEIAVMLSQLFPDLHWKLPPKREFYDGEHPRMIVFDAVAAGFAYWQLNSEEVSQP